MRERPDRKIVDRKINNFQTHSFFGSLGISGFAMRKSRLLSTLLLQGYSVFLQALIQGVALVVNTIAELLASLGASIVGASVRALQLRIAWADVVHKYVEDDH